LGKYINWPRLAAGSALVAALLLPLYFLVLRSSADPSIAPAVLLDTPATAGQRVGISEGSLAPDFEVSAPGGGRVRLSELRGRPVLINFWATWCVSCLSEMPEIKGLQSELGLDSFSVLAINAGETRSRAQEFIDFLSAPFLFGLDADLTVADAYGVSGLPLSVFIDSTGVIQAVYRGHAPRDLLERFVQAAIRARPPGEIPVVIRTVTTIPRERVLVVREQGRTLRLTSKTLRCDITYCADKVIESLRAIDGVTAVDEVSRGAEPALTLKLDGTARADAIVQAVVAALEAHPDPLYEGSPQVKYEEG
jgi:thiol-disulfide isomerase/thioredoxin